MGNVQVQKTKSEKTSIQFNFNFKTTSKIDKNLIITTNQISDIQNHVNFNFKIKIPNFNQSTLIKDDNISTSNSIYAAITRALFGALGFFFRRPVRLFRPVKLSALQGLQTIAREKNVIFNFKFLKNLIKEEGIRFVPRHILPPFILNSIIGFTLFYSYTFSSNYLIHYFPSSSSNSLSSLPVYFISGSIAGFCQSLISTPLDNARFFLLQRQTYLTSLTRTNLSHSHNSTISKPYTTWRSLLLNSVFHPLTPSPLLSSSAPISNRDRALKARLQFTSAYSSFGLSIVKDSISFAFFFTIFEFGRSVSRSLALSYDNLTELDLIRFKEEEGSERTSRRSKMSLVLQSFGILFFGGIAGWFVSIIGRPFDRIRELVWESRRVVDNKFRMKPSSNYLSTIMKRRIHRVQLSRNKSFGDKGWKLIKPTTAASPLHPSTTLDLIRNASQERGFYHFLFSSAMPSSTSTSLTKSSYHHRHSSPTRLSHKYRHLRSARIKSPVVIANRGRNWSSGSKVLTFVPPYALGLLVYSLMSGDLS